MEERKEAKRLLGDIVAETLDKVGIAKLVKRHFKNCRCYARQQSLNRLHLKLTGESLFKGA